MFIKKFNDKCSPISLLQATEALGIGNKFKTGYEQTLESYLYEWISEEHGQKHLTAIILNLSFEPKTDINSSIELLLEFYSEQSPIFQDSEGLDLEEYLEQLK